MTALTAGTWTIDPAHSEIGFTVRHLVSKVRGSFSDVEATVVSQGEVETAKVSGSVAVASVSTGNSQRDGHLQTGDFFEAEAFPRLSFVSTGVEGSGDSFTLHGDLTMKGITKPVDFQVEFGGTTQDANGVTVAGAEATAKISREDFGLSWNASLEAGGVLVGSEVTIRIDAEFQLQA